MTYNIILSHCCHGYTVKTYSACIHSKKMRFLCPVMHSLSQNKESPKGILPCLLSPTLSCFFPQCFYISVQCSSSFRLIPFKTLGIVQYLPGCVFTFLHVCCLSWCTAEADIVVVFHAQT